MLPGGGPVYIPTLAFANFVLGNLQTTNQAEVPLYQKVFNLYAGSSGAARATPVASALDPALGCGDFTGFSGPCAETFRSTVNNLNTEWLITARVDYNITSTDRIYFRFNTIMTFKRPGLTRSIRRSTPTVISHRGGGQFGYTKTLGTNMVNHLLLSATDSAALFGPTNLKHALNTFPTTFVFNDGLFSNLAAPISIIRKDAKSASGS